METASDAHSFVGMVKASLPIKYQMYNWPKLMAMLSIPATVAAFLAIFFSMYMDCKSHLSERITAAPILLFDSLDQIGASNTCMVNIGKFYYPSANARVTSTPGSSTAEGLFFQECKLNQPILDVVTTKGVTQCPEAAQVFSTNGLPAGGIPAGHKWRDALTSTQPYAVTTDTELCFGFSDQELQSGDKPMPDYATTGFPMLLMTIRYDICPIFLPTFGAALGYVGAIEGIIVLLAVSVLKLMPLNPKLAKKSLDALDGSVVSTVTRSKPGKPSESVGV
jgi:hypothetical protein